MSLFDGMLKDGETLFKDETVLDFDYLPELLPYRESQQQYIADCIKPLAGGRQGRNLLVSGAPGIGKTSCVRHVFRELEKTTDDIKPIFVNCWRKQTSNRVLAELASGLGVTGSQFKSGGELWEHISKALGRFKGVAVALDEIDAAREHDFLYQIAENVPRFTLIMITNEKDFLADMDARIRSRLVIEELAFPPYKKHETEGILDERKKLAFYPGVWGEEAFRLVVDKCHARGDVRTGIVLLREAGRNAEREASKRIGVEHVMKSKANIVEDRAAGLGDREKKVLEAVRESPGIESGELSEALGRGGLNIPDSTLRRILQRLDKGGYIFREQARADGGGKTMKHFVDE